jgi:hypothetical protein
MEANIRQRSGATITNQMKFHKEQEKHLYEGEEMIRTKREN